MYNSKEELISYAKELEGLCLREKCNSLREMNGGKGRLGQLVENSFFMYENNSKKEADFENLGIELKVAPIKKGIPKPNSSILRDRKGIKAKERITISMINYRSLVHEVWDVATVKKKLKLLLMFYLYEKNKMVEDYKFEIIEYWEPSNEDLNVICSDWHFIQQKIASGNAHLISEGDTMYLGAATKGANASVKVKQPFSDTLASPRAFSLKVRYVDAIIEELLNKQYMYQSSTYHKSLTLNTNPFSFIYNAFNDYAGLTLDVISQKECILVNRKAKHCFNMFFLAIIDQLIGSKKKRVEVLTKANIEMKIIVLNPNGVPKESMSFEQIDFDELSEEKWESSKIREKFENIKHFWVVLRAKRDYSRQSDLKLDELTFESAFYWNMPIDDLEGDYKRLWLDTQEKIRLGNFDNFIKASENRVGHIRPKARNSSDLVKTKNFGLVKKKCFWLNNHYISEEIRKRKSE